MKYVYLLIVVIFFSCGGSSSDGSDPSPSVSDGTIETSTYTPDSGDSISLSYLPTVTESDATADFACDTGTTTSGGLSQGTCSSGTTYYFACDDGNIVLGGSPTSTGTKYSGCASIEMDCGSGSKLTLGSSGCTQSKVSMSDYTATGDSSGGNEGDGGSEGGTQTESGTINKEDPVASDDNIGAPLYYDAYSFEASSGQTITVSIETFGDFNGFCVLYNSDDFDTTEIYHNRLDGIVGIYGEEEHDFSFTFTADGTYIIGVSSIIADDSSDIIYTLTWTIE